MELQLGLPAGLYRAEWADSASGEALAGKRFAHPAGNRMLASPVYRIDIALRVKLDARWE